MAESSGEKTEEPTHKRLQEARRKGQVAQSRELTAGAVFIVIFSVISFGAASWFSHLLIYMRTAFAQANRGPGAAVGLVQGLSALQDAILKPLVAAMVAAIAIGFLQTGGVFSWEALKIDPQRLMPNFKKFVSANAAVEMLKGFVKVVVAGAIAWSAVEPLLGSMIQLAAAPPRSLLIVLGYAVQRLGMRMAIVVAVIGFADFLWQRHHTRKELMMTRDEVKREYKESEGDPHHKAERNRLHRELLEQRMLTAVRKADFVVVNPDHIAVAVRYDREGDEAPQVIAKGERLLAQKIKEIAREAGVPIFRDVSLARALRDVEEGDEIPEALYEAVAEILRVVYEDPAPRVTAPAAPASGPNGGPWRRA